MKSVFSAVSCPSCAYCQKINFLCAGLKKTHCHGICCTSCCVYIIHHKYRKTRDLCVYPICIFQVLTPLYGIEFFLRSCASYLLYQMLIPWDPCKITEPFCQIRCLVKASHPFFSGMQRNGNDQIRLPPFQIFFSEDAHCLCIKIPIFPTSVILKSYQRLSPDLSVPENTSALRKMMSTLAAVFTVFFFHFYRSSAFHTPGTGYRSDLSGTLRTDQPIFFFQYLMTQRAFFRVKHVQ